MNQYPLNEPQQVTANDTMTWRRHSDEYPPSNGWILSYALRGPSSLDFTATSDADGFVIDASAPSVAGEYFLQGMVSNGTERHTIHKSTVSVLPDLSTVTGAYDGRSTTKIILDALDAVLAGDATKAILEMDVDGTRIKNKTTAQLMTARGVYALKYWREKNPGKLCPSVSVRFPGGYDRFAGGR